MTAILGPLPCHGCRRLVWADRIGSFVRIMEGRKPHDCPDVLPPPVAPPPTTTCGAWMRNVREHCARRAGHSPTGGHRRRLVMDDDALARRGKRYAA